MNRRDSLLFKDLYTKYNQNTLIDELTKIREEEWVRQKEEGWARQSINVTVDSVLTAPNTPCSTKSLQVKRNTKARNSIINDSFTKSISIEKTSTPASNSGSKRKKGDVNEEDIKPFNEVDCTAIREEEPAMKCNGIITTRSKPKVEAECPKDKAHQVSSLTKKKSLCRRTSSIEPQIQNAEEISKPIKARKIDTDENESINKIYYSVLKEPPIELPDFKKRYINTERSSNNSFDFESIDEDDKNCYEFSARQTRSEPRKRHLKLSKGNLSKPKKSKRNTISTLSRNREAIGSTNRNNAIKRRNKTENQDVEEKSVIVIEKRTAPLLDSATIKEIKVNNAPESEIQDPLLSDNVSDEANDNRSETVLKICSNIDAISVNDPHKTSVADPTTDDIGESVNIKDTSKKVAKKTRSCHRATRTKSFLRTKVKSRSKTKAMCNKIATLSLKVDIKSNSAVENTTQIESGTNAEKASVDEIKESFQDSNKDEFKSLEGSFSTNRNATNESKLDGREYTEKKYLDTETDKTNQSEFNEKNSHDYNETKPSVDQCFENHNDSNEIISINSNYLMIPEEKGKENDKISPYKPRNSLKHTNDDLGKMFQVDELLRNVGVLRTSKVSLCVKAAIFNGHIDVNENLLNLKTVILEIVDENYCPCRKTFTATLENLMYQPDHGGYDREELNLATVKCSCASGCSNKDCDVNSLFPSPHAIYVTNICKGSPTVTTGHYHNHCDECPNFGMCIGDYRESHCLSCHEHFFKNGIEGLCSNCNL